MIRNIIKLIILVTVSITSLEVAGDTINQLVKQVKEREQTITDAIIKQQVQKTFAEVEKKIEEVAAEEQIEIVTEKVEMKPPVEKEEKSQEQTPTEQDTPPTEVTDQQDAATEEVPQVSLEDQIVEIEITVDDLNYIGHYLVDNYFLDGYKYYTSETDPVLYERKKLTHEMESYVISSLASAFDIVMKMEGLNSETISACLEEATQLATEFKGKFADVGNNGEEFNMIYNEIVEYFDQYTATLGQMKDSFDAITQAPNQALVLNIIMQDLNQVIIPGIKDVMNKGFELKNTTNAIYIEGLTGVNLLTREDVISIIMNPKQILDQPQEDPVKEQPIEEAPTVEEQAPEEVVTPEEPVDEGQEEIVPEDEPVTNN